MQYLIVHTIRHCEIQYHPWGGGGEIATTTTTSGVKSLTILNNTLAIVFTTSGVRTWNLVADI